MGGRAVARLDSDKTQVEGLCNAASPTLGSNNNSDLVTVSLAIVFRIILKLNHIISVSETSSISSTSAQPHHQFNHHLQLTPHLSCIGVK